jgi:hypothetical protein
MAWLITVSCSTMAALACGRSRAAISTEPVPSGEVGTRPPGRAGDEDDGRGEPRCDVYAGDARKLRTAETSTLVAYRGPPRRRRLRAREHG